MKSIIGGALAALLTLSAGAFAQNGPDGAPILKPGQGAGAPPAYAFDITKGDVDFLLKDHPGGDKQIRVVDMGKYNMGVGIIYRGPTNDKPGDPIHVLYHDYTAETYIIQSGSGILTTGGVIDEKKASNGMPNVMNGPGGGGIAGRGAYSRRVSAGDIILIPTGVAHGWSQITDHVTYLSVRPDPDRVLPSGWVYPTLLQRVPAEVKTSK
jgi:mannose-6-phosphate isomerase-like protein (cupin superfamily)